jgi:hypothetical protein
VPGRGRREEKKIRAPSGETLGAKSAHRPENGAISGGVQLFPARRETKIAWMGVDVVVGDLRAKYTVAPSGVRLMPVSSREVEMTPCAKSAGSPAAGVSARAERATRAAPHAERIAAGIRRADHVFMDPPFEFECSSIRHARGKDLVTWRAIEDAYGVSESRAGGFDLDSHRRPAAGRAASADG